MRQGEIQTLISHYENECSKAEAQGWVEVCYEIDKRVEQLQALLVPQDPRSLAIAKVKTLLTDDERVALFGDADLKWVNG